MMDQERAAAKRRASFGRTARLAKEARENTERKKLEAQRKADREKADQQREADAAKAVERRMSQARSKAEQRRMQRHKENMRAEFGRTAEDRKASAARADQQRADDARKAVEREHQAGRNEKQRQAEGYVDNQYKRQASDQREEHRRQTHRLRVEHQAERTGFRHREAGGIVQHARQVRNIDMAERRDLEALDVRRHSLAGRAVGLIRGAGHYNRQAQAIVDRHETARWQKHRDHEGRKDALFHAEQASRLRQVIDRRGMAQRHQTERAELSQAQDRARPRLVEARVQALSHANENQKPRLQERQLERQLESKRPTEAFKQAARPGPELAR